MSSDVSHSPGVEQEQTGGLSISYRQLSDGLLNVDIKVQIFVNRDHFFSSTGNIKDFQEDTYQGTIRFHIRWIANVVRFLVNW